MSLELQPDYFHINLAAHSDFDHLSEHLRPQDLDSHILIPPILLAIPQLVLVLEAYCR